MSGQPAGEAGREGLFAGLKNLLLTALSIGRTRAELLVTELEEEKYRLIALLSRAIFTALLLFLGVTLLVFWLVLLFWEQRILLVGLLAGLCLAAGWLLSRQLRQQVSRPSALFRSSLAELDADIAQLQAARMANRTE